MAPSRVSPPPSSDLSSGLTKEQLEFWHTNGYLLIPDALSQDTVKELHDESIRLLNDFSLDDHPMTKFSTGEKSDHVGDSYFLESGDKVRFFFEEDPCDYTHITQPTTAASLLLQQPTHSHHTRILPPKTPHNTFTMSDWDSVTKIGKNVRGPGADRETTVRGKSALNAAQRSGAILSTDKKYSTANAASANLGGQRLTKVDRADGPVATKKVPEEVAKALMQARNQLKNQKGSTMTQKDLASKANVDVKAVADLERTGADFPAMDAVLKLQKAANVRLTGSNIGAPMLGPKKKA